MSAISFTLVSESSTEAGLVPHLRRLCVRAGATEALGTAPDLSRLPSPPGRSIQKQVEWILAQGEEHDLIFVHRDADARDAGPIRDAIFTLAADIGTRCVPVVPIQELEAWLLLDERLIREVAGKPHGRCPLDLPRPRDVERLARPKEKLAEALLEASETTGRRRDQFRRKFGEHRRILLQRLDINGPVARLSAWQRLVADTKDAITGSLASRRE